MMNLVLLRIKTLRRDDFNSMKFYISVLLHLHLFSACLHGCSWAGSIHGVDRLKCGERNALQVKDLNEKTNKLNTTLNFSFSLSSFHSLRRNSETERS